MLQLTCAQDHHIHSFHFDDQYSTFNKFGYARGPAGEACVGDEEAFVETRGEQGQPLRCACMQMAPLLCQCMQESVVAMRT